MDKTLRIVGTLLIILGVVTIPLLIGIVLIVIGVKLRRKGKGMALVETGAFSETQRGDKIIRYPEITLDLTYTTKNGAFFETTVNTMKCFKRDGNWYLNLVEIEDESKTVKSFRLDRIEEAAVADGGEIPDLLEFLKRRA